VAEVFLCATGQLTDRSRRELRRAGVVVVEVEDPAQCQFIRSTTTVSGEDMLWAAMNALSHATGGTDYGADKQRNRLVFNLIDIVEAAHAKAAG
jgi:hypothetical protein